MTEDAEPQRKKGGRPRKHAPNAKRPTMSFRISSELHEKLIDASNKTERSLSEEIERRLEDSFREPEILYKTTNEAIKYIVDSVVKAEINKMGGPEGSMAGEKFGILFSSGLNEAKTIFQGHDPWHVDKNIISYLKENLKDAGLAVLYTMIAEIKKLQPRLEDIAKNVGVDISGLDDEAAKDKIVEHIRSQQENSGNK